MIERFDYQEELSDRSALAGVLARTGLSRRACEEKALLVARAATTMDGGAERPAAFFVPGRIEVLGKHTDYAGGRSLVTATERGFAVVVTPRHDDRIEVVDAVAGDTAVCRFDPELTPPVGHWSNYPLTVVRRVARNFPAARRGCRMAFASDLPPAAGMSSSSALMVATFLALDAVNELSATPEYQQHIRGLTDLAGYLGTVENGQTFSALEGDRGVGTFGGSEDHTAILTARPGRLSQYAYCPVRLERTVALPEGYTLAIGASGVAAEKTGAAREQYNRASRRIGVIEALWRGSGGSGAHLADVLAGSPDAVDRLTTLIRAQGPADHSPDELLARLEHFFVENEQIVPAASEALAQGDLERFGTLVDQSQQTAEDLLGNQVPQTSYLAASARCQGAAAASAFGAGFGGSVWALVESALVRSFLASWAGDYRDHFPQCAATSAFFATGAGPAAFRLG